MPKKDQHQDEDAAAAADPDAPPLQAVLLADAFGGDRSFAPLPRDASTTPLLCPLNNIPLIDYSLDMLLHAGVQQVFVLCVSAAVEEHVQNVSNQNNKPSTMNCTILRDGGWTNVGDALRELDKRNLVKSDPFLLMHGNVITNVSSASPKFTPKSLQAMMDAHAKRHAADNSAIFTMLLQPVGSNGGDGDGYLFNNENSDPVRNYGNPSAMNNGGKDSGSDKPNNKDSQPPLAYAAIRAASDDLIIGLDPLQENRVVVYDNKPQSSTISIPCSFFGTSHSRIELHDDLADSGLYLCSPDVLARFSDEFDYRDLQREFLTNSVAEEEEGLQNRIFAEILSGMYAARVQDARTYHAVSQDLLQRWCYPVVPDRAPVLAGECGAYSLNSPGYLYRDENAGNDNKRTTIARSTVLRGPGMVGRACVVGERCNISKTVIGNRCTIEDGVTLADSHLWDDVVIGAGASIQQSILAQQVRIGANAVIGRGCIIGRGCVVGANVVLPEFTRLTRTQASTNDDDDDDGFGDFDDSSSEEDEDESGSDEIDAGEKETSDLKPTTWDHDVVGPDGIGFVWKPQSEYDEDDSDAEEDEEDPVQIALSQSIGYDLQSHYRRRRQRQDEDEDDGLSVNDDEDNLDMYGAADDAFTFGADPSAAPSGGGVVGRQRGVDVIKDLKEICMEFEESSPIENLSIELNSYKFSQNATYSDCTHAAMLAIVERMDVGSEAVTVLKLPSALQERLKHWAPLLQKMSIGVEEERSIIHALEQLATDGGAVGDKLSDKLAMRLLLQTLHDEEILSEEAILSWASERREEPDDSPRGKLFRLEPMQQFLEWLEEESEDDDDDDDEDSD